jgi:cob(I)alamin adenosyltransferase
MPRLTKITTRKGDAGATSLAGGRRVRKDAVRIEACGTVDELNSVLGVVRAAKPCAAVNETLAHVQNDLFHLGCDLCYREGDKIKPLPVVEARHIEWLEAAQEKLLAQLKPLGNFVLPGGTPAAAQLHVARTVCRRAERRVVALNRREKIGPRVIPYLNRLGDLLFTLARYENWKADWPGELWDSRR